MARMAKYKREEKEQKIRNYALKLMIDQYRKNGVMFEPCSYAIEEKKKRKGNK